MNDWIQSVWSRVHALDQRVAAATGEGTTFDAAMRRTVGRLRGWTAGGAAALVRALPEAARDTLNRIRGLDPSRDPTGLIGAAIVFALAYLVTRLFWTPLSWPASMVNTAVSTATPSSCSFMGPQNFLSDNACGTVLAVLTMLGAIAATLGLLLIRLPLRRTLTELFRSTPAGFRFLGAPLLATVLFTIGWAGVQYHFPERPGIVTDGVFPVVVGLVTYGLATYGAKAQMYTAQLFDWRDGFPIRQRIGVTLLTPVVFSLLATPILHTPVRDQSTVLVAMLVGYVLMTPRTAGMPADTRASEQAS